MRRKSKEKEHRRWLAYQQQVVPRRTIKKERNGAKIFISIFLILFQLSLAWNEFIMVFFNFSNFFVIFLEFSITHRVGTKRNDSFLFSLFPILSQPILAWNEFIMVFFNFLNFYVIFLEFSIMHWVGTKRNDNFLFSHFPILSQPILAWNEFIMVFFNFFLFFWNFPLRVGQERNGRIIFILSISHPFTTC